jgi:flavin reductase (DIM6/NTAB) family NADH-FMN oxidoreductase RutF
MEGAVSSAKAVVESGANGSNADPFLQRGLAMEFDFNQLPAAERYELLLGTVVPRPIALITTLDTDGALNAAPYSLFNVMGHEPPIMAVSVLAHPERRMKDTGRNILATEEFVINLVTEELAESMNITCIDAPAGFDELKLAGLETVPSTGVKPPRIAAAPVAFECKLLTSMSFGPHQAIVIGRVTHAHVADAFVLDAARALIDTPALKLIGAMHGARWYARLSDRFDMERPTWAGWTKAGKV